jgi:signal transduction histidine kinase
VARHSLTARTLTASALVATVLVAGLALLVVAIGSQRAAGRAAVRAQSAVTVGTQLERSVVALQGSLRGFVATGKPAELAPFRAARKAYPAQVQRLRALAAGDKVLRDDAQAASERIDDYIGLWALPLLGVYREHPYVARAILADPHGQQRVDDVRKAFDKLFAHAGANAARKADRADSRSRVAVTIGIIDIALVVIVLAGVSFLLRRGILAPIQRVATASGRLAKGDLTVRVDDERSDELGDLARAFNELAAALEAQRTELAQRATELEQSNRELEDYASVTSHDLQGPLVTIGMYAGLLAQRLEDDDEARLLAEHIRAGTDTMRTLVRDLLGYARLERTPGRQERVQLDIVIRDVLAALAGPMGDAGADVVVGPLPVVVGDGDRLRQLLQNLITNAIKFTDGAPPRVEIDGRADGDWAQISVRDHGIGFAAGQAELIFRPFQRLHSADQYEGTGIGLAVCQKIVDQHGGRVWAESTPGQGAAFHFTVPLAPAQPAATDTLLKTGGLPT